MSIENKNPQSIDISDGTVEYRHAVNALNQAVTSKIFEQGLTSNQAGLPTLIETNTNRIFAITGKTDERGPETKIDDITDNKQRVCYVMSPDGLVWISGGIEDEDHPEKLSTAGVSNLADVIANARPAPEEFTTVYYAVEAQRARGVLPMGVLQAEGMEPNPEGTLTEEESLRISKENNRKGRVAAKIKSLLDSVVSGGSAQR
ncbi:MAG: hypothetical protein U0491_00355 [Candidatus Saccharimonadales bacterium]